MKKVLLFSMMCFMALTIQAQRGAVLDFQVGTNVTEEEVDGISYGFRSNFNLSGYTLLERTQINRTIKDLGYSRTDMSTQQMLRVGRSLDATIIIVGTLNKFMDEYSVDFRVINVSSGTTSTTESATFQKSGYREAMKTVAQKLAKKITGISSPSSSASTSNSQTQTGYTDLGLPSGTKWKSQNVSGGLYTYNEAFSQFGNRLPSKEQWLELITECQWTWYGRGYKITGPNGNSIDLPGEGWSRCGGNKTADYCPDDCSYWSSTPDGSQNAWGLDGQEFRLELSSAEKCSLGSVRLVQK